MGEGSGIRGLWKVVSPGAFDVAGRVIKAGAGDVSDSGRAYNLFNELGGEALGQRITEVNVEQALGFKASQFGRDIRDASANPQRVFASGVHRFKNSPPRSNSTERSTTSDARIVSKRTLRSRLSSRLQRSSMGGKRDSSDLDGFGAGTSEHLRLRA